MKSKYFICIFIFCYIIGSFVFAQHINSVHKPSGDEYWYILKQAQNAYDSADYGDAIKLAENAKSKKKELAEWESFILDQTQKNYKVRKVGDYLEEILPVLKDKNYDDAVSIINKNIESYGMDFFHGKFSELCKWIDEDYIYPEADYLIGKIYKLEGEFDLAYQYLIRAYENLERLDIPDVKYDILYEMAEISEMKDDLNNYEQKLLAVLKDDKFYTDTGFMNALVRLINQNKSDSVQKFFLLYRSENDISIKALILLNEYYSELGDTEKAIGCAALGSIAAVTKIEETLKDRLIDYSYDGFADLLGKASLYKDILVWGNDNEIWKLFYNLAETSNLCKYNVFAKSLLEILSKYEPEEYWRKKSSVKLSSLELE
ncbi:MAG: hypothetical protein K6G00_04315 [Treponema sp.]|nr:hypothetical protein [Treponema sp.]